MALALPGPLLAKAGGARARAAPERLERSAPFSRGVEAVETLAVLEKRRERRERRA